jgi:hypothetical protein
VRVARFFAVLLLPLTSQLFLLSVAIADELRVTDPWSVQAFSHEAFFDERASDQALRVTHAVTTMLYIPPLNILSLTYFKVLGRIDSGVPETILRECGTERSLDAKIVCLSRKTADYAQSIPQYDSGFTRDGRTFCAVAANLFARLYNSLNIPRSRADFLDASLLPPALHVANVIFLTSPSGVVFSYVIDAGNLPGVLFPLSQLAINFHTRGSGVETVVTTLPNIDFMHPGDEQFHP